MTGELHRVSRNRVLVIASRSAITDVLVEHAGQRPVVALLASHEVPDDPAQLELVIQALLDNGCEYFVCFGAESEALHDRIDELIAEHVAAVPTDTVMTTWHSDETPADVADFFFNVAAANERSLLVAALDENDAELARLLVQRASA